MVEKRKDTWKRVEGAVARRFGGQRIPVNGRGDQPDVKAEGIAVEVKHRKALPLWLQKALAQAVKGALPGQLPVVVLHQLHGRHDNDLVLLRLHDFEEVMNLAGRRGSPNPDDTG